jgi:hypothetical protein
MSAFILDRLLLPLPDVDGLVHGIVSVDPPRVQCDGCGLVATGQAGTLALTVMFCDILFSHRDRFTRRLCGDCRKAVWS